jgi:hypothetical protein
VNGISQLRSTAVLYCRVPVIGNSAPIPVPIVRGADGAPP